MPISHFIHQGYTEVIWSGVITSDEIRDHFSRLIATHHHWSTLKTLTNLRDSQPNFNEDEFANIVASSYLPHLRMTGKLHRIAILVTSPNQLAMSNIIATLASLDPVTLKVFEDREQAIDWLRRDEGSKDR